MLIKSLVLLMLALIFASLFSALVFLFRDKGQSTRTVQALTWRIGLSLTLFILLMAGFLLRDHPTGGHFGDEISYPRSAFGYRLGNNPQFIKLNADS